MSVSELHDDALRLDAKAEARIHYEPAEQRLWQLIEPPLQAQGYEIVHLELNRERAGTVLRVFIDRGARPVGLSDCSAVSRLIGDVLDVEDPIRGRYHLEVSSPGLDRPLSCQSHFQSALGRHIEVRSRAASGKLKRNRGLLTGVSATGITLDAGGNLLPFTWSDIRKAHIVYEFAPPGPPPHANGKAHG